MTGRQSPRPILALSIAACVCCRHNNEPAWFPVENPQPGQRLDIWMMRGFDFVRATIWYHPNDWYQLDFQTGQP